MRARVSALALALTAACGGGAEPARLLLGTTHTVQDSGLLEEITRTFARAHPEQRLSAVVAGSGEVLAMAARGDVDVVLTHSPEDELRFVEAGHGSGLEPVMYSDFVLLGPRSDPANAAAGDIRAAFQAIARGGHAYVSRADNSGTHRKEMQLWQAAGLQPPATTIEAGTGMADALRLASQRGAYILSDRPTFDLLQRELELHIVQEGDPVLLNPYSVLLVTHARNPEGARAFATWIGNADARRLIASFRADETGRPLFLPGAPP